MIRENRPVGVVNQPGQNFDEAQYTFGTGITFKDMYAQTNAPWAVFYLADQLQDMVTHIEQGWFQPGTIVVFRSIPGLWNMELIAAHALRDADAFVVQKMGGRGYNSMADIGKLASEFELEMVWQWSNEIGNGGYDETMALCKFELERARLIGEKQWNWKVGALATAVGNIGKPDFIKALVDSKFMEANLNGELWWLTHYYGVVASEALMLDNQFPVKGSSQDDVAAALSLTNKESINASDLYGVGPAFRVMEHLMYPETKDANIIVSEWHYYDKARDTEHEIPYSTKDGRGHTMAWAFVYRWWKDVYPTQYEFILSELEFISRLAGECPGEVHVLAWTFGSGGKRNWADFDWRFETAYTAYVHHVTNFVEEPAPPTPEPEPEPLPEPEPDGDMQQELTRATVELTEGMMLIMSRQAQINTLLNVMIAAMADMEQANLHFESVEKQLHTLLHLLQEQDK